MAEQPQYEPKVYTTFQVAEIILGRLAEGDILPGTYTEFEWTEDNTAVAYEGARRCAIGWLMDERTCVEIQSDPYHPFRVRGYPFANDLVARGLITVVGPTPDYEIIGEEAQSLAYEFVGDPRDTTLFLLTIQRAVDRGWFNVVEDICKATLALKPEYTKREVATLILHKLETNQICSGTYLCSKGKRCAIGWLLPYSVAYDIENTRAAYVLADDLVEGNRLIITDGDAKWARSVQSQVDRRDFNNLIARLKKELI